MKEDMLLQIFTEETSGKNHAKGQRVLNNDLVSSVEITSEESLICIDTTVISEDLFNEYTSKIEFDAEKKSIVSTYCSCPDYENNEFSKHNYCCKHLVASFYKSLEELLSHPLLMEDEHAEEAILKDALVFKDKSSILSKLLGDERQKEELKLEVYINRNEWSDNLSAEFKLGLNSMSSAGLYILKDINQFLLALYTSMPISYGKKFTFNKREQRLSTKDKRLVSFIETLKALEGKHKYVNRSGENFVNGKYINIPKYMTREFFELISKHRVYLNEGFFYRPVDTEILYEAPELDFDLKLIKGDYVLKSPNGMPRILGDKRDVFLYGSTIYLPDYDFCYKISPYLQVFNEAKVVTIPSVEEDRVLRRLIPDLTLLSPRVTLSKAIKDKIVMGKCGFNFYLDQEGKEIILTLKVKYDIYEFNIFEDFKEKIIYRDSKQEAQVIAIIKALGFEENDRKFYFSKGDEYRFKFFKYEIGRLQELGEVYYSERFKGIKSINQKSISADISAGKYDYFEMDFKIEDIADQEITEILRAFRDNLKYYKLKDGEFLDLEQIELKSFLKLLDSMAPENIEKNHMEIPKSRGIYLNNYIEENDLRYITGVKELKEISEKVKNIEKLKFTEPKDLKGSLREYQKVGFNWFRTLDYLGFGGILGDEMGLGKTLQSIAFLLSNSGRKSLIVAPTSLTYNWINEFEKFAPSMKVAAVNGLKEEREELIKNYRDFDVLITTYNLLRRDSESYSSIEFDYCILDEAQNIKNPHSQNAAAAKDIKAKNRFALSGTPIENSLMELWSIFDFIMPGYLYDEKRFSVRYHKKLKEDPVVIEELNKLIKPFILRRKKKEVIKELPDKIEKTLVVNMDEEQKKVYKAYADYAVELIAKKVKEDEFKNSKIEILAYLTKLRQLCLDPSVLMNDYTGSSGKMEAIVELLSQSIEEGHRILVFSQFTMVLKNIAKRIDSEGIKYSYLDGAIPSEKRMHMVQAFNEGENSVFLISLKAGGTGLNLTSADVVIHFDPWWNPAVEEQATDRAHRIGQRNVVEVIKLIAKGTIEEKIISLQQEKKHLISQLMSDELSSGEGFGSFNEEDIISLFSES